MHTGWAMNQKTEHQDAKRRIIINNKSSKSVQKEKKIEYIRVKCIINHRSSSRTHHTFAQCTNTCAESNVFLHIIIAQFSAHSVSFAWRIFVVNNDMIVCLRAQRIALSYTQPHTLATGTRFQFKNNVLKSTYFKFNKISLKKVFSTSGLVLGIGALRSAASFRF